MERGDLKRDEGFVPPSRLYLPKLASPPATILDHLAACFPKIGRETWQQRMARGVVTLASGAPLDVDAPYRCGVTILYRREVAAEPEPDEEEILVYRDRQIIVVDKPHGMPVTPAGDHLHRSLLVRLQQRTGCATLAPIHRLDRETAGLVLFTIQPEARGPYHRLFAEATIEREYLAAGRLIAVPDRRRWRVENRIGPGEPWFRQSIVAGPANAVTEIELIEIRQDAGLFRLRPLSGKKHQLRLHMASLGFPIIGDPLYPDIAEKHAGAPPLQLLAMRLAFIDPLSGQRHLFVSSRRLAAGT